MTASKTRYLCSELVRVTNVAGPQPLSPCANLEEVTEHSAELLTESPFARDASVHITSDTYEMEGIVESCVFKRQLGYLVRVKLAPWSSWSEKQFTPKHLLRIPAENEPKVSHLGAASGY